MRNRAMREPESLSEAQEWCALPGNYYTYRKNRRKGGT